MSIGRNAPCPCGSGKKYKQCCGRHETSTPARPGGQQILPLLQHAFALHRQNQLPQAEAAYRQVLNIQPDQPDALHMLGQIAEVTGHSEQAIELVDRAIQVRPGEAHYRITMARLLQGHQPVEAEKHARKALRLQSGLADGHYFLANTFKNRQSLEEAAVEYRKALSLQPDHPGALNNLSTVLSELHRYDEALAVLKRFVAIRPGAYEGLLGTAIILRKMGHFEEAVGYHEAALALLDSFEVRFSLSLCALAQGQLGRGWVEYETRFRREQDTIPTRPFPQSRWCGQDLREKRLLVWNEQGVGDEILFAAEIGDAIAAGAKVWIECDPRLKRLFTWSFPSARVITRAPEPEAELLDSAIDFQTPAGGLGLHFRQTIQDFPHRQGYLTPDPERVMHWQNWLAALPPGRKVGISWRSLKKGIERDLYYSALTQWKEILAVPDIVLVNLQYGECEAELLEAERMSGARIWRPPLDLKDDLDEAAALTRALDGVIAPNNSVFAMAGAVGTPTWLLNLASDWTMLGTNGVPWFPQVRVRMKTWQAPWETPLQQVAMELAAGDFPALHRPALLAPPPEGDVQTLLAHGYQHMQSGRNFQAECMFWRVLAIQPDQPDALNLLGLLFLQTGRPAAAVPLLKRAIAARPEQPAYPNNLGNAWRAIGSEIEALRAYEQALAINPGYARAHSNTGIMLSRQNRREEAETHFRRAVELEPEVADHHANLGNILLDQGRPDAAIAVLEQALKLNPQLPEALSTLGAALGFMSGELSRSLNLQEQAIARMPGYFMARWRMSAALLASGNLKRGWEEYGWRFRAREGFRLRYPQPEWAGESVEGKRILVWGEQGVGDEILFAGLFEDLRAAGATLTVVCEPRLQTLFARSFPFARVVAQTLGPAPDLLEPTHDFQVPAGNIARWTRTEISRFPSHSGYLRPDPSRIDHWSQWLAELGTARKIGISWRSMTRGSIRNAFYTDLKQWGEVLKVKGVTFVNLQYGDCEDELREAESLFGVTIHRAPGLNLKDDLDGAAALTRALDLVIAPNTSVFAMAGAVGTPTWLLNLDSDWTMLGTNRMPWFPSVEVFAKSWEEPWENVLSKVAARLSGMAEAA